MVMLECLEQAVTLPESGEMGKLSIAWTWYSRSKECIKDTQSKTWFWVI